MFCITYKHIKKKISRLEEVCFNWELKRASIVLNKRFSSYNSSVKVLLDAGFSLYAAKIEVCRELNNVEELERQYTYRSIAEGTLSEKNLNIFGNNVCRVQGIKLQF